MPKLSDFSIALNFIGVRNLLRTFRYTLHRDWLNWRYSRKRYRSHSETIGPLLAQETKAPGCMEFNFVNFGLEIQFLSPELARINWCKHSDSASSAVTYAIDKNNWPSVNCNRQATSSGETIASAKMQIYISHEGEINFLNPSGQIVHQAKAPRLVGKSWIVESTLAPEECIFGLGEQAEGLNLRGSVHQMINTDPGGSYGPNKDPLYFPFPVYMGLNYHGSYLVFHDNPYPSTVEIDPQGNSEAGGYNIENNPSEPFLRAEFESPTIQYYFFLGAPGRLVEIYTELTGRTSLPPLWALGYHQSRWGYASEQEIREVAANFKNHDMPISAIHLDIDYMDGYRVFTVDSKRYPDLPKLAADLSAANIHLVTIIDPGVKVDPEYSMYREGLSQGLFCVMPDNKPVRGLVWPGWSVYPDFTYPEARQWWGSKYKSLLEQGIDGFWHDMNEPTSFSSWGGLNLPFATQHHLEGHLGDHRAAKNIYALQMNRSGYEALQALAPEKRPWLISRSGWAGNQRYAWNWTGDTDSTWDSLKMTITTILGLGLCGIPFTGPDIGGFSGNPSAELYLRWFQLATFLPYFRTHSAVGTPRREPWVFGEPYTSILRDFLRLRYHLLPYLYTLAWESTKTGAPPIRPLFWNHPEVEEYWGIGDEFLLGDALLVAPVLEAACHQRNLVFPPGQWVSFWDDDDFADGPCTRSIPVDLPKIPLFIRAGAILPMKVGERLVLHVYPPKLNPKIDVQYNGFGQLYSDQGDGYGPWRLDKFNLQQVGTELEISWDSVSPTDRAVYPFPYQALTLQMHGCLAHNGWVDGCITDISGKQFEITPFNKLRIQLTR